MDSTTLFTFMFDCPVAARTVELLGSWDNFSRPYQLKRDVRRSPDTWTGCFTFQNIICDGDFSDTSKRREGALKQAGTYWYYYKINDDEEHHNISEPSTTSCPLLPGQPVNVLEVPMESSCRSGSPSGDSFTRNPDDRYLNPVPPKPLPSPRLGDLCKELYAVPMHGLDTPRSATYPSTARSLTPIIGRHARSASSSPYIPSNSVLADFKGIKEKLVASTRTTPRHRGRSPHRNVKELQISAPTLVSTTAEDMQLVALPSQSARQSPSPLPMRLAAKRREFSPLSSHPVDVARDCHVELEQLKKLGPSRPHTDGEAVAMPVLETVPGRIRANSADTRRTRQYYVFPNEPWITSPRLHLDSSAEIEKTPVLERPSSALAPLNASEERPISRNGEVQSSTFRTSPLDKDLPPLPRFLVPAPLFACNDVSPSPKLNDHATEAEGSVDVIEDDQKTPEPLERSSQFSTISGASTTFGSWVSEEGIAHSPTMTSLTSVSSDAGSPCRLSGHFTHGEQIYKYAEDDELDSTAENSNESDPFVNQPRNSRGPPLLRIPVPSFGPDLFQLDLQRPRSMSNRQTACYGVSGFQGYSLPQDATTSQATITKTSSPPAEPTIANERLSAVSQLDKLMSDFGFLGEAVL
ncbi:hypothetical protein K491DRAFT_675062 [Lophiostoma macrostomum CBS 122681]|uniref:Uncharacterized protein n=1 Tax=Lophiostoma macrostomum CBS 122681 TaxID=1314788 RepID=A0A6A6TJ20_9PLEO|nr:hypothetical protein K491DRAFT_675062 [Lophiostoma macrostomum CBS 122681]